MINMSYDGISSFINIRKLDLNDIPQLEKHHQEAFTGSESWNAQLFLDVLTNPVWKGSKGYAAIHQQTNEIIGFIIGRAIDIDCHEIYTMLVSPPFRKQGIALKLLQHYIKHTQLKKCFLEVAVDNPHAVALYKKFGFQDQGKRLNYYIKPTGKVDALVMVWENELSPLVNNFD